MFGLRPKGEVVDIRLNENRDSCDAEASHSEAFVTIDGLTKAFGHSSERFIAVDNLHMTIGQKQA